jgi:aspartate/tyrosine/aromatic aminotransferase
MGLYADSPSILSIATQNTIDRDRINSQLRALARSMYLHPPLWGAQLAHMVLSDPNLYPSW